MERGHEWACGYTDSGAVLCVCAGCGARVRSRPEGGIGSAPTVADGGLEVEVLDYGEFLEPSSMSTGERNVFLLSAEAAISRVRHRRPRSG